MTPPHHALRLLAAVAISVLALLQAATATAFSYEHIGTVTTVLGQGPPLVLTETFESPTRYVLISSGGRGSPRIHGHDFPDTTCAGHEFHIVASCVINGTEIPYSDYLYRLDGNGQCIEEYRWTDVVVDLGQPGSLAVVLTAGNTIGAGNVSILDWSFYAIRQADLSLVKSAPDGPVSLGSPITYSLSVRNAGPSDAPNVRVEDYLPPGVAFVSAVPTQGVCTHSDGLVICELGTVAHGDSAAILIEGVFESAALVNVASVLGDVYDPDAQNNSDQASTELSLWDPTSVPAGETSSSSGMPRLSQNAPNPFNPQTRIRFRLEQTAQVDLVVYDAAGRVVRRLLSGERSRGSHEVLWDGRRDGGGGVASGVYFYELRVDGGAVEKRKAVLLR